MWKCEKCANVKILLNYLAAQFSYFHIFTLSHYRATFVADKNEETRLVHT